MPDRILLYIVCAALVCELSCSRSPAPPPTDLSVTAPQPVIVFGRARRQQVKSVEETTAATLLEKGFRVHGQSSDGQTDFTDTTLWDSISCCFRTASMEHFYPTGDGITMDYEAVYPSVLEFASGTIEYALDRYDDIVAATRRDVGREEVPVMLEFRHLLSRVSVSVSPQLSGTEYEVSRIAIVSSGRGRYSFPDAAWGEFADSREFTAAESEAVSVFPGEATITVAWKTRRGGIVTGDYCRSVGVNTVTGRHSIVKLTLSDDLSTECGFTVDILPWDEEEVNLKFD